MNTLQAFEKVLRSRGVKPIITQLHKDNFEELDKWLQGAMAPGLVISGPTGSGKTAVLEAIAKILREHPETVRKELRHPGIRTTSAMRVCKIAHEQGRKGLLYNDGCLAGAGVLVLNDVASPYEEATIRFQGWDAAGKVFIDETLRPISELIEHRANHGLPTLICTELDFHGIEERYGRRVADRLFGSCAWMMWGFESYR